MSHTVSPAAEGIARPAAAVRARPAARRLSRRVAVDLVGVLDALAITLGALVPALIYSWAGGVPTRWSVVVQIGLLAALIGTWCLNTWRLYDADRVHDFPIAEHKALVALLLAFGAVLGLGLPFHANEPHLWVWYFVWASMSYLLLLMNRTTARVVLKRLAVAGHFDERVAVFGAGPIARRVRDHLLDQSSRIAFAGMFDDRPENRINPEGLAIAGRLEDLVAAAHAGKVDRIIVALPAAAEGRITGIVKRLESAPASVHIVTHLQSDLVEARPSHAVSALGPVGMLDVKDRALSDWSGIAKRGMDLVLGSLLMIVALPVMALIAGLIALGSSGPILVRERRRGLNDRTIDLVRFRITRTDDLAPDGVLTPIGRILDRHGLDELPQLWSVLRGDMSLVGPRPFPLATSASAVEQAANLHQVKPGLTGLDRVSVGSTPGESRGPDLVYVERWSPSLDLEILSRTVLVALFGRSRR